jgi:hypothetical protein
VHEAAAAELERHATVAAALWETIRIAPRSRERAQQLRLSSERERQIARREYAIAQRLRPQT